MLHTGAGGKASPDGGKRRPLAALRAKLKGEERPAEGEAAPLAPGPGEAEGAAGEERGGAARKLTAGFAKIKTKLTPKSEGGPSGAAPLAVAGGVPPQAPGAGSGGSSRRLQQTEAAAQLAAAVERERDVLVRLGLAAFAVAAYIKTVLCPSLPRQISAGAGRAGLLLGCTACEGQCLSQGRGPVLHC